MSDDIDDVIGASARKKALDEVKVLLENIEARFHHHYNTMDAMYAKDAITGKIQAIQIARRAVEKLQ